MMPDVQDLQKCIQLFVRSFGLLKPDHTPCGQPMSTSLAHALQVLGQSEGIAQQALAEQLGLDKSTTSRLVNQLVKRGWVDKSVNPQSRREVQLSLTQRGRSVLMEVLQAASAKFRTVWEQISIEKRPQVLESLSLLTNLLREKKR